jgi:hypothetical protein
MFEKAKECWNPPRAVAILSILVYALVCYFTLQIGAKLLKFKPSSI